MANATSTTQAAPAVVQTNSAKLAAGHASPLQQGAALTAATVKAHYAAAHKAAVAGKHTMVVLNPAKRHNPPGIAAGKVAPTPFAGQGSHNTTSWQLVKALLGNGPQYPAVLQAMLVLAYGHGCYVGYLTRKGVLAPTTAGKVPATLPAPAVALLPPLKGAKHPK